MNKTAEQLDLMKAEARNTETRQPLGVAAYEKIYQKIVKS